MGTMRDDKCPWDSDSENDEDEDWLYSSVSRYQHLLMCKLGVVGSCLAISSSGRRMALAGKAGDREELAVYKMPGKLMADNPVEEGLTSSRDFGLLAGTVQAGKIDQLQFMGENSVVVGQTGSKGVSLWGWEDQEGDLVTCKNRWDRTEVDCRVLEGNKEQVFIAGGCGTVARLGGEEHWEERKVSSSDDCGRFTSLLIASAEEGEHLWVAHSSLGVQMIDWRAPQDLNRWTSCWGENSGQCSLLLRSQRSKCVVANLKQCGLLNLTSPSDGSPLGEVRLPISPSLAPTSPLLARGSKGELVASIGGKIWIINTSSLSIEFCHDGHALKGKGNEVKSYLFLCLLPHCNKI